MAVAGLVLLAACQPTNQPGAEPGGATATATATATSAPATSAPATSAPATGTPATTATASASPSATSPSATKTVVVYFGNDVLNPGGADCGQVYGVSRTVPASADVLTASMEQLLAGPTATETAQGYTSWFSSATKDALISAKVTGATAYVDLADIRTTIPNASTSCGSQALLAQLTTTAQQAALTPRVRFAIEGDPRTFWEWLQRGCDASNDNCDARPFS